MEFETHQTIEPKLFIALVFLLSKISEPSFDGYFRMTPEEETNKLKELLSLTDAQAEKVMNIHGNWQEGTLMVLASGEEDPEILREGRDRIMKEAEKELDLLLTADQKGKLTRLGLSV